MNPLLNQIKIGGLYKQKPNPNSTWCCGHFKLENPLVPVFEKLPIQDINRDLPNHFKLGHSILHVLMLVKKRQLRETSQPFQLSKYDIGCFIISYMNNNNKPSYCRLDEHLITNKWYHQYTFLDDWELIS